MPGAADSEDAGHQRAEHAQLQPSGPNIMELARMPGLWGAAGSPVQAQEHGDRMLGDRRWRVGGDTRHPDAQPPAGGQVNPVKSSAPHCHKPAQCRCNISRCIFPPDSILHVAICAGDAKHRFMEERASPRGQADCLVALPIKSAAYLTPTSARRSTTPALRSSLTKQHTVVCPAASRAVFSSSCACMRQYLHESHWLTRYHVQSGTA